MAGTANQVIKNLITAWKTIDGTGSFSNDIGNRASRVMATPAVIKNAERPGIYMEPRVLGDNNNRVPHHGRRTVSMVTVWKAFPKAGSNIDDDTQQDLSYTLMQDMNLAIDNNITLTGQAIECEITRWEVSEGQPTQEQGGSIIVEVTTHFEQARSTA